MAIMQGSTAAVFTQAIGELGALLAEREVELDLCVIGGAACVLQDVPGFISTADVDVAAMVAADGSLSAPSDLPEELRHAAADVADWLGLPAHWINAAASASFGVRLPEGFLTRANPMRAGTLTLRLASHADLVALKLLASGRRGAPGDRHRQDLVRLAPTAEELRFALEWVESTAADGTAGDRARQVLSDLALPIDG